MKGQVHDEIVQNVPGKNRYILFHAPTPKGVIHIRLEDKNTLDIELPYYTSNLFSQVTPPQRSCHAYAQMTQDEDKPPTKVNDQYVRGRSQKLQEQATMIISPRAPASFFQQALNAYLGNAMFDTTE